MAEMDKRRTSASAFRIQPLCPGRKGMDVSNHVTTRKKKGTIAPVIEIFLSYLRFGYHLRLLPYKIRVITRNESDNPESGSSSDDGPEFTLVTSVWDKAVTGITNCLSLYAFFIYARQATVATPPESVFISPYLDALLTTTGLTVLNKAIFFATFWKNSAAFLSLFQLLNSSAKIPADSSDERRESLKIRIGANFLCLLSLFMVILCVVAGHRIIPGREWSPVIFVNRTAQFTRFMFFVSNTTTPPPSTSFFWTDYFLCSCQVLIQFWNQLSSFYSDLAIQMLSLMYVYMCIEFVRHAKGGGCVSDASALLQDYEHLQMISDQINKIEGAMMVSYFVEMIYFAVEINDFVGTGPGDGWPHKLRYFFFPSFGLMFLYMIAWATQQVERTVRSWLHKESKRDGVSSLSHGQLMVFLNEVDSHRVSLSAKELVTITFGFIGTVFSAIVTYSIIIYQLKQ